MLPALALSLVVMTTTITTISNQLSRADRGARGLLRAEADRRAGAVHLLRAAASRCATSPTPTRRPGRRSAGDAPADDRADRDRRRLRARARRRSLPTRDRARGSRSRRSSAACIARLLAGRSVVPTPSATRLDASQLRRCPRQRDAGARPQARLSYRRARVVAGGARRRTRAGS